MAQMRNLLTAALLGTVLFASCKKDKDNRYVEPVSSTTEMNTESMARAVVSTTAEAVYGEDKIKFTNGYVNAAEVYFEATLIRSTGGDRRLEGTRVNAMVTGQHINVFYPKLSTDIKVPFGYYNNGMLKFKLEPMNEGAALFLDGHYIDDKGNETEIRLAIQDPVQLQIRLEKEFNIGDGIDYLRQLPAVLPQYTRSVDMSLWQRATVTDGVIHISASSNGELYKALLSSFGNVAVTGF